MLPNGDLTIYFSSRYAINKYRYSIKKEKAYLLNKKTKKRVLDTDTNIIYNTILEVVEATAFSVYKVTKECNKRAEDTRFQYRV